jgi:hypothetical protein
MEKVMAYVSQEDKKRLAPGIKAVLKKYGMKGSIGVQHYSTLVVKLKSGKLDLIGNYNENARDEHKRPDMKHLDINLYWVDTNYSGKCRDFIKEIHSAMRGDEYFDESDSMSDYFHCSHYMTLTAGDYNKPYVFEGAVVEEVVEAPVVEEVVEAPVVEEVVEAPVVEEVVEAPVLDWLDILKLENEELRDRVAELEAKLKKVSEFVATC